MADPVTFQAKDKGSTVPGLWLLGVVLLALILAACGSGSGSTPSLEKRAQSIDKKLMCPVCPAETIAQSQATVALDMRDFVREKLAEGWSEQQVLDYFSSPDRYGISILSDPPKSGRNLGVWIVPPVGALAGIILTFFVIRAMKSRLSQPKAEDLTLDDDILAPYIAQIDAQLEARRLGRPYKRVESEGGGNGDTSVATDERTSSG